MQGYTVCVGKKEITRGSGWTEEAWVGGSGGSCAKRLMLHCFLHIC